MCDARRLRWHFVRMIIIVIPGFVSVRMLFNDPSSRNKGGSLSDFPLLFWGSQPKNKLTITFQALKGEVDLHPKIGHGQTGLPMRLVSYRAGGESPYPQPPSLSVPSM